MERLKILNALKEFIDGKKVIGIIGLLGMCTILSIIYPFIYKFFIDNVLLNGKIDNLKYVLGFILLWLIIDITVKKILGKTKASFLATLIYKIKLRLVDRILELNKRDYLDNTANEYKRIIEDDSKEIDSFFSVDIFNYSVSLFSVFLLVIVMLILNPILLTSCMIFFVISFFETKFIKNKVINNSYELRKEISKEEHLKHNEINNFNEIKFYNYAGKIIAGFEQRSQKLIVLSKKEKVLQYVNKYFGALNHDLITRFYIYIAGGILVVNGLFSTSSFLVFLGFYEVFVKNVRQIIESNFLFNNKLIKLNKIIQYLRDENDNVSIAEDMKEKVKDIVFENVSFGYQGVRNELIIKNYSARYKCGNLYLINGDSGVGKSTLLKLLYKEQIQYEGNIYFNHYKLSDLPSNSEFYDKFAIANSDSKIFNTSIRNNLLVAKENATDVELCEVCKKALFWSDVEKMENGLDTLVGENGSNLSVGQKERLVMARIFLQNNAQVYILDEALAEISINDEIVIINSLWKEKKDSIIFVISHRLLKLEHSIPIQM